LCTIKKEREMLSSERHRFLLDRLAETGTIVAREVAAELHLSEDSIRRDLRDLASQGLVQRVYGGALPVSPATADLTSRASVSPLQKERVAKSAADLLKPGMTTMLDGGSTALAVATHLPAALTGTIISHSPTVISALIEHPGLELLLLGGRVFKHSGVTSGAVAAEAAMSVRADLFLLGVTGVHHEAGLTTGDSEEAGMKRLLSRRAAETWVMASSEKIGAASAFAVVPTSEVAGIITDAETSSPVLLALQREGVHIRFA
jgi:DeoR/GlpR family transcriptional regulator of sugar metabolism